MQSTYKKLYLEKIVPAMQEQYNYPNAMMAPKIEKVVVNMGVGDAPTDAKFLDSAMAELAAVTGQKPAPRKARKSIASFKLRQGNVIGCMTTLRGERMYEFIERLITTAIPRIRDFRGVAPNAFDGNGNYTLGVRDQTIFPEVDMESIARVRGMNVTFVIKNSSSKDESRDLLRHFGMPFRN